MSQSARLLLSELSARRVKLRVEGEHLRFQAPKGSLTDELKQAIGAHKAELIGLLNAGEADDRLAFRRCPEERHAPFPLTELQQAYLIGEQDFYEQRTKAFFYQEYTVRDLDVSRLRDALDRLIHAHDVLRISVRPDGTQVVLEEPPRADIVEDDLRGMQPHQAEAEILAKREGIERDLPDLAAGPPLHIAVQRLDASFRVHIVVRLFAFDGVTLSALYRDLLGFYADPAYRPDLGGLSYRDYVLGLSEYKRTARYQRSIAYWQDRLDTLPRAPDLPRSRASTSTEARFRRKSDRLSREAWAALRQRARGLGLPINSVLCAVYADTLRRWSTNKAFTLNVMAANRPPSDPDTARVIGNCSTTSLLAVPDAPGPFTARVLALQAQLYADLEHNVVSGVEVIRALSRRRAARTGEPLMPVVFTSGIALSDGDDGFHLSVPSRDWKLSHSYLKTPQVWLDHQVYEEDGELVFNWDYTPDVFPAGMIEAMFEHYRLHLAALSESAAPWSAEAPFPLPARHLAAREAANATRTALRIEPIHAPFNAEARRRPDRVALISGARTFSYGALYAWSAATADALRASGVGRGDVVAVFMKKSPAQIAGVLGALQAGAAYLPIDGKLPAARVRYVLEHSGAKAVLIDGSRPDCALASGPVPAMELPAVPEGDLDLSPREIAQSPDDIAYIIYTSGSTGKPKGVVIDHRGAATTIQDILRRFEVTERDRLIALSSIGFDLSVFDVFGALAVGAALVVPEDSDTPDPERWATCVLEHGVTVWNSVPALLEMTLELLGDRAPVLLRRLRLLLLSGDWVPLGLVERVLSSDADARLIALGGATEASIWSNYFAVASLDPSWTSVPYGFPLANQSLHVLDERLAPSPTWALGDLYIGGDGLAKGYLHDPERTAESFIVHPETGDRLYRTGDLGRYHPDGWVEFCGRKDAQVKIRGYRIELGEIEARLCEHPRVHAAVALVQALGTREARLVAFVVSDGEAPPAAEELRAWLADRLPSYMVPAAITTLAALPLSANGKVDRGALLAMAAPAPSASARGTPPRDAIEAALARLWGDLLGTSDLSIDDDFFERGGNSLLAVRLFNGIEQTLGRRLPLSSLFRGATIAAQAEMIRRGARSTNAPLTRLRDGKHGGEALFLVHPVGGDVLSYRDLARHLPEEIAIFGLRAPGLDGDARARSLGEMASLYLDAALAARPEGSIHLGGWSMGGVVAYEMARQLVARGHRPGALFMIDSWAGSGARDSALGEREALLGFFTDLVGGAPVHEELSALPAAARLPAVLEALQRAGRVDPKLTASSMERLFSVYVHHLTALRAYEPMPISGERELLFFRATRRGRGAFPGLTPWLDVLDRAPRPPALRVVDLDADHHSIMGGAAIERIARQVEEAILRAGAHSDKAAQGATAQPTSRCPE